MAGAVVWSNLCHLMPLPLPPTHLPINAYLSLLLPPYSLSRCSVRAGFDRSLVGVEAEWTSVVSSAVRGGTCVALQGKSLRVHMQSAAVTDPQHKAPRRAYSSLHDAPPVPHETRADDSRKSHVHLAAIFGDISESAYICVVFSQQR
jgi:hypothetical protein